MTPFQPEPPTQTRTNTPTATPTATSTPTPTNLPTLTPTVTPTLAEATVTLEKIEVTEPVSTGGVTVPILLYHHVSASISTQYNVPPANFEIQMQWLYDNGYSTITISELANAIRNGDSLPERQIVITFDDGFIDVYNNAYPILQKYGYEATFFIIAESIGQSYSLSTSQLEELIDNGWEIGSHSFHHSDLTKAGASSLEVEIQGSKDFLEEKLGVSIQSFAYPYGLVNPSVIELTKNAGYTSAVGLGSKTTHFLSTLYFLNRREVKSWFSLQDFINHIPWS